MGIKKEKSCGAVLLNDKNEYLVLKHFGGHWDFPKGHVEPGETETETALREVFEETGLNAELIPGFREVISYNIRGKVDKDVVFFIGRIKADSGKVELQLSEVSEFKFLPYEEARKLITFDTNRSILDKADAFLKNLK
ncbi:MAG: bis(5'-nucleosyl)-tetraphosphatase [Clostridiaceae bacterium]